MIQYHFVRGVVQDGEIYIQYISSEKNIADQLTKRLSRVLQDRHMQGIGIECKRETQHEEEC